MKGTEPFSRLRSFQHPFKPFVAVEQWLPKGKLRPEGGCYIIIRFAFKITLVLRLAFGPSLGHEIWPLLRGPPQYCAQRRHEALPTQYVGQGGSQVSGRDG